MELNELSFGKDDLMRTQLWCTLVLSIFLTAGGPRPVQAQFAPAESSGSGRSVVIPAGGLFDFAGDSGVTPVSHSWAPDRGRPDWSAASRTGAIPSAHRPAVPQAAHLQQPRLQPWPQISPYDHAFSEHYTDRGLWFWEGNNRRRQYFARWGYMRSNIDRPKGTVGNPNALSYKDIHLPFIAEVLGLDDLANVFRGDVHDPTIAFSDIGFFPPEGQRGMWYYNAVSASETNEVKANGLRAVWGFTNPDDTGLRIDAWWSGRETAHFNAEKQVATRRITQPSLLRRATESEEGFLTFFAPFESIQVLQANLLNLGGLPIDDGTLETLPDGTTIGGATVPYDIAFELEYESENAGTSLSVLLAPVIDTEILQVRPLVGARYTYLREKFSFFGEDSGMYYDNESDIILPTLKLHSLPDGVDNPDEPDGIVDNAGQVEGSPPAEVDSEDATQFVRLDILAETFGFEHPGRYQAFLDNEAESHMAGPEAGLQYNLGGDGGFRIRGFTKFALLANAERIQMEGNNIGNANDIGIGLTGNDELDVFGIRVVDLSEPAATLQDSPLITPTPENPNPNAFEDKERHTRLSPLLEQSIFVDLPVFHWIPVVNRMDLFENAKLSVGYTYTFMDNVLRPAESIRWQGNPREGIFPYITAQHDEWNTSNWTFMVEIPY